MSYILEIKQIVDYPRVRIHRDLIRRLSATSTLSLRGDSRLFQFMTLCSYVNYRYSRKQIEGIRYTICPGEWLCSIKEIASWFRVNRHRQAIDILEDFREQGLLSYHWIPGTKMVRYRIANWEQFNTVLEYECRCQKDSGFFFFPIALARRLTEGCRCSELDIIMDLWMNTIYMDGRVKGSDKGPVVYFRNATGDPRTSYSQLGTRWGISKATVCRLLTKLEQQGYITTLKCTGSQGSVIYLCDYLSTMFNICDTPIDKDEVALDLSVRLKNRDAAVSQKKSAVSKPDIKILIAKVLEILSQQGLGCARCEKGSAILYRLSACGSVCTLDIYCARSRNKRRVARFTFQLFLESG